MTTNLINSLVQCLFKSGAYSLSQNMKDVAADMASQYSADASDIKALTHIFENKGTPIGALKARIEKVRTDIKAKGLPNPVATGHLYVQRRDIADIQTLFDEADRDLVGLKGNVRKAWSGLVHEAKARKGGFTDHIVWPTVEDFLDRYKIELRWLPQPMAIPAGVLSGLTAEVRAEAEAASKAAVETMLREAHIGPVRDVLKSIGDMLESFDGGKKRFRQEPFDKLKAAAQQLDDLNWLRIPEIGQLCDSLHAAGNVNIVTSTKEERDAQFGKVKETSKQMRDAIKKMENDLGI